MNRDNLDEQLRKVLEKYLEQKEVEDLLRNEKVCEFVKKYCDWFKWSKILLLKEKDNSSELLKKLNLRFVILFSIIEDFSGSYGTKTILDFFSCLNQKEKFLMCFLTERMEIEQIEKIPIEYLLKEKEIRGDYHQYIRLRKKLYLNTLLYNFLENKCETLNREFENLIKALYDLRSQVVHKGGVGFIGIGYTSYPFSFPLFITGLIKPYKEKTARTLSFKMDILSKPFWDDGVFEELIFIALVRKNGKELKRKFFQQFNKEFIKILRRIKTRYFSDLYPSIRNLLTEYIKKIRNELQESETNSVNF